MPADVPIRCDCAKRVLLAIGRADDDGKWIIHVRVHRGGRIMGEVVSDEGPLWVRCRECLRWHKLTIRHRSVDSRREPLRNGITLPPLQLRDAG